LLVLERGAEVVEGPELEGVIGGGVEQFVREEGGLFVGGGAAIFLEP
jgi:hypothetical protein